MGAARSTGSVRLRLAEEAGGEQDDPAEAGDDHGSLDETSGKREATSEAGERRAELLTELQRAAQRSTTDGILFHQAVADRRCLNLLSQSGPLTAGELGQQTGLGTTGAVTRMVDRLERAGYVRRQLDPRDRRRVIIRPVPERLATLAPHYQGMATAWTDLLAGYSDQQLELFLDLFDRMHQMSQQQLADLRHGPSGSDDAIS